MSLESQAAMKRLSEVTGGTYWRVVGLYGVREVVDLRTGHVDTVNFDGDTLCNVVSVNRDNQGKPPILFLNSANTDMRDLLSEYKEGEAS